MTDITNKVFVVDIVDGETFHISVNNEVLYSVELNVPGTANTPIPPDGVAADVLTKDSATPWDMSWQPAPVTSVNTQTGAVVLDTDDISEGILNLYYNDSRVAANTDVAANTAARVPSGGTLGQVLAKASGTDWDMLWVDQTGGGGAVDSVFGRTGAVVAVAGDYNSDQVTEGTINLFNVVPAAGLAGQHLRKIDGSDYNVQWSDAVDSVFGRTGAVVAVAGDYTTTLVTEGTNLYYTEARVSANTDVAANTAARHTHANKAVLDLITDAGSGAIITVAERADLHTHANKVVIDAITDAGSGSIITAGERSGLHTHANKAELDLITDGDHDVRTDNPHGVTQAQLVGGITLRIDELSDALAASTAVSFSNTVPTFEQVVTDSIVEETLSNGVSVMGVSFKSSPDGPIIDGAHDIIIQPGSIDEMAQLTLKPFGVQNQSRILFEGAAIEMVAESLAPAPHLFSHLRINSGLTVGAKLVVGDNAYMNQGPGPGTAYLYMGPHDAPDPVFLEYNGALDEFKFSRPLNLPAAKSLNTGVDPILFDDAIDIDALNERTPDAGVTVEEVLVKDGHIDLKPQATPPARVEGRVFYDDNTKAVTLYPPGTEVTHQLGQELLFRVYNDSGADIPDGRVVTALSETGGVPNITLASATSQVSAVAMTTELIENGTYGMCVVVGAANNLNTAAWPVGTPLWLSETAGLLTDTPPESPSYLVECGIVLKQDAATGIVYFNASNKGNEQGVDKFFNGSVIEHSTTSVNEAAGTVSLDYDSADALSTLSLIFDAGLYSFSVPASVNLTAGTDTVPVQNYVFIPEDTKVLTANTTGFPADKQVVPVARVLVQSAASVATDGVYKHHRHQDHLGDPNHQGHLSELNFWIRNQHGTWLTGGAPNIDIQTVPTPDNIYFDMTAGTMLQLHVNTFPAVDTETGDSVYVVNEPGTPYNKVSNLNIDNISQDSTGGSLSGRRYSLVILAAVSSDNTVKMLVNLPSGSYGSDADAISDAANYDDYSLPAEFKGTGILIARAVLRHQVLGGGTHTLVQLDDLRGNLIGSTGGGTGAGATGTEFSDALFRVFNATDASKEVALDVSGVTTGNTRTMTVPDEDGTLVLDTATQTLTNKTLTTPRVGDGPAGFPRLYFWNGTDTNTVYMEYQTGNNQFNFVPDLPGGGVNFGGDFCSFSAYRAYLNADSGPGGTDDPILYFGHDGAFDDYLRYNVTTDIFEISTTLSVISGALQADTINERTGAAGVTVDGVLIKDGAIDKTVVGLGNVIDELQVSSVTNAWTADYTDKATPVSGDFLVIEDSAAGFAKKRIQIGNLPTAGGGEVNTASSQGTGTSIFYQKSGVDLQFNAIKSENTLLEVALDAVTHDVELTLRDDLIDHANLIDSGSVTHSELDTHVGASSAVHGVTGAVVGTTDIQTLTNKTLTTPTIIATGWTNANHDHSAANTGGKIDHNDLNSAGANDHVSIDAHIDASTGVHGVTGAVVGTTDTQTLSAKTLTTPTIGDFTNAAHTHTNAAGGGQLDHSTALTNIGTNTHAQIDTHLASTSDPHSTIPSQTGNSGKVLRTNGSAISWVDLAEAMQVQIELTVNEEIQYVVPFAMTITGWTMLLDVSGSAAVDVWHDTYANHPPTDADSIVTPSVTSAAKNQGSGLSLSVSQGDVLIFHVDSVTTATLATVALTGVREA